MVSPLARVPLDRFLPCHALGANLRFLTVPCPSRCAGEEARFRARFTFSYAAAAALPPKRRRGSGPRVRSASAILQRPTLPDAR
jgi:hypothetical protein